MELIGKLNDSNRKLEKLSQMKSAFVATVSHEIRTSLTTSKLAIENLKDVLGEKLTDTQERIIDALRSSVVRLNGTVEELLDLAKIEAGKMTVKRELFDVCGAIDEVVVLQSSSAKTKNISLTKACKGGLQPIWGDKDKITQVLMNILSNAMKFTPSGGRITVDARAAHEFDGIQVEIADTGPGIAPDRIEKIFNRFESQSESNRSGVGIGLHVSKEIVGLHNGKIWAESELGKGSKFIIQLPMDLRKKRGVKG
ncbi:MAG: HAMP domain-containing sensor histidine kinase [Candidatus Omnitrophota bacterium]